MSKRTGLGREKTAHPAFLANLQHFHALAKIHFQINKLTPLLVLRLTADILSAIQPPKWLPKEKRQRDDDGCDDMDENRRIPRLDSVAETMGQDHIPPAADNTIGPWDGLADQIQNFRLNQCSPLLTVEDAPGRFLTKEVRIGAPKARQASIFS